MLLGLNVLLTPEGMLQVFLRDVVEFEPQDPRSKKTKATGLSHVKEDLSKCFFDSSESPTSEGLASHPYLRAYPQLREALNVIYALESTDDVSLKLAVEQLKGMALDWTADDSSQAFERINRHLGYFKYSPEICELFKALARLCRTSMVVVEGNEAVTDEEVYATAYTLMALCIKEEPAIPKLGDLIKSVNRLIDQRDKKTKQPIGEMFLHFQLPISNEVKDRKGWFELIKKEGERALPFFTQASKIEEKTANKKAPQTIRAAEGAAALVKYARGEEDPEFARLCYAYDKQPGHDEDAVNGGTLERVFNLSLDYMKTGWPKKTRDTLPNLVIKAKPFVQAGKDVAAGYYWVKLPPTDKRALILGKITDCCQSIGGHSQQCVKDGVSLEDNGFYVLLKHQRGDASKPIHDDGSINYENFQIIGESYAWKSTTGDVCLDSIEHLRNSIPADVLKHMLTQFAQEVLASDSSMMRVHVGQGGGTPESLFPETRVALKMRQGVMYGDAETQYVIAQSPELMLAEHPVLKGLWKAWQDEHREMNGEPRRFLNFLSALLPLELTQVLKAKNANGQTLLHVAALGVMPFNVSELLLYYVDDAARRDALMMKADDGETVLHTAADSPESLVVILSVLPEDARLAAVQEKDGEDQTVLHAAANNLESLRVILSLYPEDARLAAVQEKDGEGQTLLHRAADSPESLRMILSLYPEDARLAAVQEKVNSQTVLHRAADSPESLKTILSLLPEDKRLAAVQEKDGGGQTALHWAANNLESLRMILSLLPEDKRLSVVQEKDRVGLTVLHRAADYGSPESLRAILLLYPEDKRLAAVQEKVNGRTVLHRAANNLESLKIILSLYPEGARLAAVQEKDREGRPVLHRAANNLESLRMILSLYPEDARLAAVQEKDGEGLTLLHRAADSPESLKTILSLLPEDARLAAVQEKDGAGHTLLPWAAGSPESLKTILSLYPEDARLAAVQEKDGEGQTVLHRAADSLGSLSAILSLLPEGARLAAVQEKVNGQTVLHRSANNPESLRMILSLLPEDARLAAVQEKNGVGRNILDMHKIRSCGFWQEKASGMLNIILDLLRPSDILSLAKDKSIELSHVFKNKLVSMTQDTVLKQQIMDANTHEALAPYLQALEVELAAEKKDPGLSDASYRP